jgi:membrane associated rhomboid family serine protease
MRIPKTATVVISIVTGVAWLLIALVGRDGWAAMTLGFIPARFSGVPTMYAAPPAWLTPLTSTIVHGGGPLVLLYVVGAFTAAVAQWVASPMSPTPMIGASGAISAVIGAFALSFGEQKRLVSSPGLNRALNSLWLLAAWVVLQMMTGLLAGTQGYLLATPAHIGGFVAGLLLQRPLLLWRYRNA